MKRTILALMAGATLAVAAPAIATAQPWVNINARQAQLDARIDAGIRGGGLTRMEADRLRADFSALARLEADYRRSGGSLTMAERADLDRRFDALDARIYAQRRDGQTAYNTPPRGGPDRDRGNRWDRNGQWMNINARQRVLDQRIDRSLAQRRITPREAASLRAEFRQIAILENNYRRSGGQLTMQERADLDRRFDNLEVRIRLERNDGPQYGYGYGAGFGPGYR